MYAEIKLHRALQHPNIVEFEDCFEDDEHVYMTMALCENGVRDAKLKVISYILTSLASHRT